jgi:hypothetical protein
MMFLKRLLAFTLFAALAAMHAGVLRAQWYLMDSPAPTTLLMNGKNLIAGTYNGIFISKDTGLTWTLANSNLSGACLACGTAGIDVKTLFQNRNSVFAGTSRGIYISSDAGENWQKTGDNLSDAVNAFAAIGTVLFAGTADSGVYRSSDGGVSWIQTNNGLLCDTVTSMAVIGTNLFAGTAHFADWPDPDGIYLSTDSGASWTQKNSGLAIPGDNSQTDSLECRMIQSLLVSGDTIYAGVVTGIFISTDTGNDWSEVLEDIENPAIAKIGHTLMQGGGYGFSVSHDNGLHWIEIDSNLYVSDVVPTCFCVIGTNVYTVDYWSGRIYQSTDSGVTWTIRSDVVSPQPPIIESEGALLAFDGIGYTGSLDSGVTWNRFGGNLSSVPNISAINVDAFIECENTFYAGTDTGLFILRDSGWIYSSKTLPLQDIQSWTVIGNDIFAGGISSVYVPNQNPRYPGYSYLTSSGVFLSSDNGKSWDEMINYLASGDSIWNVSLGLSGNTLFANNQYTTDFGSSWNDVSIVPNFNAVSGTTIFGSDSGNVYLSNNSGINWTKILSGTPGQFSVPWASNGNILFMQDPSDSSLAADYRTIVLNSNGSLSSFLDYGKGPLSVSYIFAADGYLYAIGSLGLWRRPVSDSGISSVSQPPTVASSEIRIYPNPFSGSTTISFTSESSGYAEVSIVNALGAEVAHLYSGELAAGEHSFTWSDPNICNGMYECLVRMNGWAKSLPVVLAR